MEAFIRKRRSFSLHLIEVTNYDCIPESIFEDKSQITARYIPEAEEGDFVLCDGYVGVISGISVNGNEMTLSCQILDAAFDRTLKWDYNTEGMDTEELVEQIFDDHFINCDPMYAMSYIRFDNRWNTPLIVPGRNNEGLFTIPAYFAKLRKKGFRIIYDITGDNLVISLEFESRIHRQNIDLQAYNTVTGETYGGHTIAKITNYPRIEVEGENEGETQSVISDTPVDYYLLSDGTVTHDPNAEGRVYGKWEVMSGAEESAVLEKFAVSYGHEIMFSHTHAYTLYQPICLRMPSGKVIDSFISRVRRLMNDEHYYYTAGELKTTLTAKLKG